MALTINAAQALQEASVRCMRDGGANIARKYRMVRRRDIQPGAQVFLLEVRLTGLVFSPLEATLDDEPLIEKEGTTFLRWEDSRGGGFCPLNSFLPDEHGNVPRDMCGPDDYTLLLVRKEEGSKQAD